MAKKEARVRNKDLMERELSLALSFPEITMKEKGLDEAGYIAYVDKLKKGLSMSKQGKRSRDKGSEFERKVAKKFNEHFGVSLVRTPMSGGFQKSKESNLKGDIANIDPNTDFRLHIECKNQKTWALKQWIAQAESDCSKGKIPMTVIHQQQEVIDGVRTQQSKVYVVMEINDFIHVVDKTKVVLQNGTPQKKQLKSSKLRKGRK